MAGLGRGGVGPRRASLKDALRSSPPDRLLLPARYAACSASAAEAKITRFLGNILTNWEAGYPASGTVWSPAHREAFPRWAADPRGLAVPLSRFDQGEKPVCGRYTLKAPREAIAEAFDLADIPQLLPLQHRPDANGARRAARPGERRREIALLQWGSSRPGPTTRPSATG